MTTINKKKNNVEILCIGTEILLGNIVNTNAKWIAEELTSLGMPHYQQTVIGDNPNRLEKAIMDSSNRCRVLITTGGLGPTPDDLTKETIAKAFRSPLIERKDIWEDIKKKLEHNNQLPAPCNHKQAFFPEKAIIIPNPSGTAPGMIWSPKENFSIVTLPGVPSELKDMWNNTAIPWFNKNINSNQRFVSKVLKFTGISESNLSEKVTDLLTNENPTIAPYASIGEVKLRLTACGRNTEDAQKLIIPFEKELIKRAKEKFYGSDDESLASVVIDLLRNRRETLSVAESCTGGGIGALLTSIPNASDVFIGGVIAYSNQTKIDLLNVPEEMLDKYGSVSKPVVEAMAKGVRRNLKSHWSIAVSGLAGPGGGTQSKQVGLIHFGISGSNISKTTIKNFHPQKGRLNIQKASILFGLDQLRLLLMNKP